jgi:hypothetical protein
VLYLGASVPLDDLDYIVKMKEPDLLYTHITSHLYAQKFDRYLQALHGKISSVPIIMSGQVIQQFRKTVPPNISLKKSLAEVKELIEGL